jgi:hypothetical protein
MSAVVLSLVVLLPSVGNAQLTDEPVLVNGLYFYPTREFRIFDANVMTQVASAQRGPVYVDSTLAPNTVVYLAVGGKTMKAYRIGAAVPTPTSPAAVQPAPVQPAVPVAVGTAGTIETPSVATKAPPSRRRTPSAQTTLQPEGNKGIWIEYAGERYYADGAAAVFSQDRFTKIGEHSGFPVYRAADDSNKGRIWVTTAIDGPVAPFVKR